jgi:hypothetical protein
MKNQNQQKELNKHQDSNQEATRLNYGRIFIFEEDKETVEEISKENSYLRHLLKYGTR